MSRWRFIIAVYSFLLTPIIFLQLTLVLKNGSPEERQSTTSRQVVEIKLSKIVSQVDTSNVLNANDLSLIDSFKNFTDREPADFDYQKNWLVFLHIQKTSGTNLDFGILKQVMVEINGTRRKGCEYYKVFKTKEIKTKRKTVNRTVKVGEYKCKRPNNVSWYLSWNERFFGWPCGLHPSLSDMHTCLIDKFSTPRQDSPLANFNFITMLRSPVERYVSEWSHVTRTGSIWIFENNPFGSDQECSKEHMKHCLTKNKTNWKGVSFESFFKCKWNLAINRQARMLALYDSGFNMCYYLQHRNNESSTLDNELLERAKKGLRSLSFYGLTEYQNLSLQLFEKMFKDRLSFFDISSVAKKGRRVSKTRSKHSNFASTDLTIKQMDSKMLKKIENLNKIDILFYEYAKALFFKRLKSYKIDLKLF